MSVSPTVLLLSLAIGVPLMLLALGVLYHGYLLSQQSRRDPLDVRVEALATESSDELIASLQDAVLQLQGQMSRQRESLASLLSDQRNAFALVGAGDDRPMAAGEQVESLESRHAPDSSLRARVLALTEDGLSDRAIARELHIGLEEVRIARLRGGRS